MPTTADTGFELRDEGANRTRREGAKGSHGALAGAVGARTEGATGKGHAAPSGRFGGELRGDFPAQRMATKRWGYPPCIRNS